MSHELPCANNDGSTTESDNDTPDFSGIKPTFFTMPRRTRSPDPTPSPNSSEILRLLLQGNAKDIDGSTTESDNGTPDFNGVKPAYFTIPRPMSSPNPFVTEAVVYNALNEFGASGDPTPEPVHYKALDAFDNKVDDLESDSDSANDNTTIPLDVKFGVLDAQCDPEYVLSAEDHALMRRLNHYKSCVDGLRNEARALK
ncbi:hypothetical protein BDN72DRAFT_902158 [Pluteus cervinus]|uniref:Uncharacterized protein n=1 Tax=Pluteus cervinus TaxID=181527 RepID=A0ACD3ACV5_9AGAR|nr:hypothetical protein BDN72DRAFT_902158 [Pluteus cervinus]